MQLRDAYRGFLFKYVVDVVRVRSGNWLRGGEARPEAAGQGVNTSFTYDITCFEHYSGLHKFLLFLFYLL